MELKMKYSYHFKKRQMFLLSLVQFYVGRQKERKSYIIFLYSPQTLPQDLGLL